jgi:hypothetical protein
MFSRATISYPIIILHHGAGYLFWPIKKDKFCTRYPVRATPAAQADYFHIPAVFTDVCCDLTTPGHTCQGQGSLSASVDTNPSERPRGRLLFS